MLKRQQTYDWKDSNVALFGSDKDRGVKKESAQTEKAWEPVAKCTNSKLFIWRIEKFKVKEWPAAEYGTFYSGDSYIVLNIYKEAGSPELLYDVHFWIGEESTQDEYGTAAYKTVELDTFLDDKAVQHREVQHHESPLFRSYFKSLTYLKGGCESGFRHVTTKEYKPRLLHFCGDKVKVVIQEVESSRKCLDSGDVFILDLGTVAYQWNGKESNKDERFKAAQYLQSFESERHGKTRTEVLDETDAASNTEFNSHLSEHEPAEVTKQRAPPTKLEKALFRLSDDSGSLKFSQVSHGSVSRDSIEESDVYIVDNGDIVYVYVGKDASSTEKANALTYAHKYLQTATYPYLPVTVVDSKTKGKNLLAFNSVFSGS